MLSPTKLKELCHNYDLTPSKKYGQNYLVSDAPIKKMLEAAEIKKSDTVVEIGPGFGILTFALAEQAGEVIAFEIERKLEEYWEENAKENLEIIYGNALKQLPDYKIKNDNYKLIANLPYQITSHVLRTILELENKPESITIMVQKEVAERICSKPGEMSLLAVSVQYYGEPKIVSRVNKGNFWPEPKVDSAILYIKTREHEKSEIKDDEFFFRVVKAGFVNKRKQLWRNLVVGLKVESNMVKKALQKVCKNEKIRAEELSVEDWGKIVKIMRK